MRKLFNSGPAIYQDDIATRDIRRLKKVLLKFNSIMIIRAVFNWVSKLIQDYSGFALLRFVIGPENLRLLLKLTDETQLKPIMISLSAFTCVSCRLPVYTLCSR